MNADVALANERNRKIKIGFNNFAHAVDHYVMLIFPTVVIGLEAVYGRPYNELLALGTASFFAFGLFSLPAGWLADRWSRGYMMVVPDDRGQKAGRSSAPEVRLSVGIMVAVFALFIVIGVTAGLVFNTVTIALPKVVDERIGNSISLVAVGGIATAIFLCGAIAQFTVGRVLEKYPAHLVFAFTGLMQFIGVVWVAYATGFALLAALAFAMAFIYAQVTVNDFVIARYTADSWRGRVYAVRYFITYVISGAAISMIWLLHGRGGFDLVLTVTAVIALGFLFGTAAVALLVNGVERDIRTAQPAE